MLKFSFALHLYECTGYLYVLSLSDGGAFIVQPVSLWPLVDLEGQGCEELKSTLLAGKRSVCVCV